MSSTGERIKAAVEREAEGNEQDEPTEPTFEAPENPTEPEPEPGEPEPEPEPAPEPEPQPGGLSAEQMDGLEKAMAAYFKRVEKIFGADNVPPACPTCEGLGFDLTGGEGPPVFLAHEHYIACVECDGLGKVRTGSHVGGHDLIDCPKCQGRGYLEKLAQPQLVPNEPDAYGTPKWMGDVTPGGTP